MIECHSTYKDLIKLIIAAGRTRPTKPLGAATGRTWEILEGLKTIKCGRRLENSLFIMHQSREDSMLNANRIGSIAGVNEARRLCKRVSAARQTPQI